MNKKIVVSSNCQTAGVAAFLRAVFPGSVLRLIPLPSLTNEESVKSLIDELGDAFAWVTLGRFDLLSSVKVKLVKIPNIEFRAFHPDVVNALKVKDGMPVIPIQSRIGLWAYINRISPADAARLFHRDVYDKLGYFNAWPECADGLRASFLNCGFTSGDFDRFFLSIKRRGIFMHTHNHPRIEILAELGKLIAIKLGVDKSVCDRDISLVDGLTYFIWPVYTEIGCELGLQGSYHWRMDDGVEIEGVRSYLDYLYERYYKINIQPNDIRLPGSVDIIDKILGQQLKRL